MWQSFGRVLETCHHPAQKKMSKIQNTYEPARLSCGKTWKISYYQTNPENQKKIRFRETFNLNRIHDLTQRKQVAESIIDEINQKLKFGWPFKNEKAENIKSTYTLATMLKKALEIKLADSDRIRSHETWNYHYRVFYDYLAINNLLNIKGGDFTKSDAIEFMDYIKVVRKLGNCTYNNYKTTLCSFFSLLEDRGYIAVNPFSKIKKKMEGAKSRREFTIEEMEIVLPFVAKDKALQLAVLLIYYSAIRPAELRRLKVKDINLKYGFIRMLPDITKNKSESILTIPNILKEPLEELIPKVNGDLFLFGKYGQLGHEIQVGKHYFYRRLNNILRRLKKAGTLNDIEGLSIYSFKDTGAQHLIDQNLNIMQIKSHMRHKDNCPLP